MLRKSGVLYLAHLDLFHFPSDFLVFSSQLFLQFAEDVPFDLNSNHRGRLFDTARRQVDFEVLGHCHPIDLSKDDALGNLLSVCFVASVVLNLDVEVERAFATVEFLAFWVWTFKFPLNVVRTAAVVLLPARGVAL